MASKDKRARKTAEIKFINRVSDSTLLKRSRNFPDLYDLKNGASFLEWYR